MLDFSIIIPVYNSEKTIERCLNSILTQSFQNYEVILIDDGSSDESFNICKKYEWKDSRYRVIHQVNRGPSVARNVGLDMAKGEWVCFVDSDDYIEENYLQDILDAIHKYTADIVFMGYNKVCENKKDTVVVPDELCDTNLKQFISLSEKDMFGYTWIKSFRREVIGDIRFDAALNLFEDEVFTCQVIPYCTKVGVVTKPIYNYNIGNVKMI